MIYKKFPARMRGITICTQYIQIDGIGDAELKMMKEETKKSLLRADGMKTQEAIVDDPMNVADFFIDELKSKSPEFAELASLISKLSPSFSKEEMKALLLLLRAAYPQTELMGFVEKYPKLMTEPEVRNFVHMLFFDISLLACLKERNRFREDLPNALNRKILTLYQQTAENCRSIDQLVYYIEFTHRLEEIYQVEGYSTTKFATNGEQLVRTLLERSHTDAALQPYIHSLLTTELHLLLSKPELGGGDIELILADYCLRNTLTGNPLNQDPSINRLIENQYTGLIEMLKKKGFDACYYQYALESICHRLKMPCSPTRSSKSTAVNKLITNHTDNTEEGNSIVNDLTAIVIEDYMGKMDSSTWTGAFPAFENRLYAVDFEQGSFKKADSNGILRSSLPEAIASDPFLKIAFGVQDPSTLHVSMYEPANGVKVYLFKDPYGFPCRIEGCYGPYRYYRTFPGQPQKELQAIPITTLQPALGFNRGSSPTKQFLAFIANGLHPPTPPSLPCIYDHGFYINPSNPLEGFCYTVEGKLLFKIELEEWKLWGLKIKSVIDCRNNTGPWEVVCGAHIDHEAMKKLSTFEHPSQILCWKRNGAIERIELPRFGMAFALQNNVLTCIESALKGYTLDLAATDKEKQEISFSLLMTPPSRELPKKLLIPESEAFSANLRIHFERHYGIAWMIWFVQMLRDPSSIEQRVEFEISTTAKRVPYFIIDIHPGTGELHCRPGKRIPHFLEIAKQMLILGKFELAYKMLEKMELKKHDLTHPTKRLLTLFFTKRYNNNGVEAAVKLKLIHQIKPFVANEAQHDQFHTGLNELIEQLTPMYLEIGGKIPLSIKPNPLEFVNEVNRIELMSIEELEKEICPNVPLKLEELQHKFTYLPDAPPLLFNKAALEEFFEEKPIPLPPFELKFDEQNHSSCELEALMNLKKHLKAFANKEKTNVRYELTHATEKLDKFLTTALSPMVDDLTTKKQEAKNKVDSLIYHSKDPADQAAIYSHGKLIATYHEMMLAMLQSNLESLKQKDRLPVDIDCKELQQALVHYFDCEVKLHLAKACFEKVEHLQALNGFFEQELWNTESTLLYQLLTRSRRYSIEQNPELLCFEAINFITYRTIGTQSHQLKLLLNILESPSCATQAITGAGKTMVLSRLRALLKALMQANGKSLVTQRVLPALLKQTLEEMEKISADFKIILYPFLFDLKKPLEVNEKVYKKQQGGSIKIENRKVSIFKNIYYKFLQLIKARGCVVTDYKSFPLMEAKFFKLSRELSAMRNEGLEIPEMELMHWTYLKKILILLKNKEELMMDEFDQLNRPIHRIQLQMEKPKKPASFLVEESLKIYRHLLEQKNLLLKENLQNEVSSTTREASLVYAAFEIAKTMAKPPVTVEDILRYFFGISAEVLEKIQDWSNREKDLLTFHKDQFHIFLPLTLSYRGKSKYKRSDDGKRTLPCLDGEKHDAKFGGVVEEINYTIQDYIQTGIRTAELQEWLDSLAAEFENGRHSACERFKDVYPDKSLEKLSEYPIQDLVVEVNQDIDKIWHFLKMRLNTIMVSGSVISLDPSNINTMSRTVSGLSATIGCPDALPSQFFVDKEEAWKIKSEMLYRFLRRLKGPDPLLEYNPLNPMQMLAKAQEQMSIYSVIDGAGAYVEFEAKKVAEKLLEVNKGLQQVGFHSEDGSMDFCGTPNAALTGRGFIFSQPNTRGADVAFTPDSAAILTISEHGTLESLSQQEGRLRLEGQNLVLARSENAGNLNTVNDVVKTKACYEARTNAPDLFTAKKQELNNIIRSQARDTLLKLEMQPFFEKFDEYSSLFITAPAPDYQEEGSYHARHKAIRVCSHDPEDVLISLRQKLIDMSEPKGLTDAKSLLLKTTYPPELIRMMPPKVYSLDDPLETGLEVELEEELEMETERELELMEELEFKVEMEKQAGAEVPYYLPRMKTDISYKVSEKIHPAYHPKLRFTDSFLPLSRKDSMFTRKAFDSTMYSIGTLLIPVSFVVKSIDPFKRALVPLIDSVIIGDILDDALNYYSTLFMYDIRTSKITHAGIYDMDAYAWNYTLESEEFNLLMAQVKFLDGQVEDYSPQEQIELTRWLKQNNPQDMRKHFEKDVLQYRSDVMGKYPHSLLWKIFQKICTPE